jgi:hypothetical protein
MASQFPFSFNLVESIYSPFLIFKGIITLRVNLEIQKLPISTLLTSQRSSTKKHRSIARFCTENPFGKDINHVGPWCPIF